MAGSRAKNDFGQIGYGGPCPPGGTHRYYFTLYALDQLLTLDPGATKPQVLQAIAGHQLATAQLMGRYHRAQG
jgi:Raf kinase inhibitor-like YbhB/YbcL family protein